MLGLAPTHECYRGAKKKSAESMVFMYPIHREPNEVHGFLVNEIKDILRSKKKKRVLPKRRKRYGK